MKEPGKPRLRLVPPVPDAGELSDSRIPRSKHHTSSGRPGGEAAPPDSPAPAPLRAVVPPPIPLRRPPVLPDDDPPRGAA